VAGNSTDCGSESLFLHVLLLFCLTLVSDKSYIRDLIIKAQEFVTMNWMWLSLNWQEFCQKVVIIH